MTLYDEEILKFSVAKKMCQVHHEMKLLNFTQVLFKHGDLFSSINIVSQNNESERDRQCNYRQKR